MTSLDYSLFLELISHFLPPPYSLFPLIRAVTPMFFLIFHDVSSGTSHRASTTGILLVRAKISSILLSLAFPAIPLDRAFRSEFATMIMDFRSSFRSHRLTEYVIGVSQH